MTSPMLDQTQKTEKWFADRRCKVTASKFKDVLGTYNARLRYAERIKEEIAGVIHPQLEGEALDWGNRYEPAALANYELHLLERGIDVDCYQPEFIVHPKYDFIGCSADLLIGVDGAGEAKCPFNPANHLTSLVSGMQHFHIPQVQGHMFVTGRAWCDFISYDPRQIESRRLYVQRIYRDDVYISMLESRIVSFWNDFVLGDAPPAVDFDAVDPDDLF